MFFLTNELAKEAEITISSARDTTRPGLQAAGSWVMTKGYREGIARGCHLGLRTNHVLGLQFTFTFLYSQGVLAWSLSHSCAFFQAAFFWPPSNRICFVSGCSVLYAFRSMKPPQPHCSAVPADTQIM